MANHNVLTKENKNVPKWMKATAGLLAVAALSACNDKASANEANSPIASERPVATAEPFNNENPEGIITPDPASLEVVEGSTREERDAREPFDYEHILEEVRAIDRAKRFNDHLESAYNSIQGALSPEEAQILYMPDLDKPRAQWTGQDYLNYHTLAIWLVTSQVDLSEEESEQKKDMNEGLRAATVVADVDTSEFEFIKRWIKENPGYGLKAVYEVMPNDFNDKEAKNVKVGSNELDANGGRVVAASSAIDGETSVLVFKNFADADGNVISVMERDYDSLGNPELSALKKSLNSN